MEKKKNFWVRCRSAITGLFIKHAVADENPATTVEEKVERKSRKGWKKLKTRK